MIGLRVGIDLREVDVPPVAELEACASGPRFNEALGLDFQYLRPRRAKPEIGHGGAGFRHDDLGVPKQQDLIAEPQLLRMHDLEPEFGNPQLDLVSVAQHTLNSYRTRATRTVCAVAARCQFRTGT